MLLPLFFFHAHRPPSSSKSVFASSAAAVKKKLKLIAIGDVRERSLVSNQSAQHFFCDRVAPLIAMGTRARCLEVVVVVVHFKHRRLLLLECVRTTIAQRCAKRDLDSTSLASFPSVEVVALIV